MKATRARVFWTTLVLCSLGGAMPVLAQEPVYPGGMTLDNTYAGRAVVENTAGTLMPDWFTPRFVLEKQIGGGIGYDNGYTNLGIFFPHYVPAEGLMTFIDARALITDEGRGGANVGGGLRSYHPELNRIFGLYGYWDLDDGHAITRQQVGMGIESLGQWLDFRANGYLPIERDPHVLSQSIVGNPFFGGNQILAAQNTILETVFAGFDAEVGGPLPFIGRYGINGYVGGYYFTAQGDDDAAGVRGRAEALVTDDFTFGVTVTHDDVFDTNVWLTAILTLPDGIPAHWFRQKPVCERLLDPVRRDYRVHTNERVIQRFIPESNPADNLPFTVLHVDPNATTPGVGTFEQPFNSMQALRNSDDVDIIFVRRRTDDTTTNLVREEPLQLLPDQRLLSNTIQHDFTSTRGTLPLPGFEPGAGMGPILTTQSGEAVILMASGGEVSGFNIDGQGVRDGINGFGGDGFRITNNTFQNTIDGAVINDGTGLGVVANNLFLGNNPNQGLTQAQRGFVTNLTTGGTLDLQIYNNVVQNHLGNGMEVNTTNGTINADVQANRFENNAQTDGTSGLAFSATGGNSEIDAHIGTPITDDGTDDTTDEPMQNVFIGNGVVTASDGTTTVGGAGLAFDARDGGVARGRIINTTFDGNGDGVRLTAENGRLDFGNDPEHFIADNTFVNQLGTAVRVDAQRNSAVDLELLGNTIGDPDVDGSGNQQGGLYVTAEDSSLAATIGGAGAIDGNLFDQNGDAGAVFELAGTTVATVDFQNNSITNTTAGTTFAGEGLQFLLSDDSVLRPSTVINNTITDNAGTGILVSTLDRSHVEDLVIQDNIISRNGGAASAGGLRVQRADTSLFNMTVAGNTVDANIGDGLMVQSDGANPTHASQPLRGTPNQISVSDNVFSSNVGDGLFFNTRSDSVLVADVRDNMITANQDNGIYALSEQNSAFGSPGNSMNADVIPSIFDGNTITENVSNGILLEANEGTLGSYQNVLVSNSSIRDNGADGVRILYDGSRPQALTLDPNLAPSSRYVIQSSDISNNANEGIGIALATKSRMSSTPSALGSTEIVIGDPNWNDPASSNSALGNRIVDNGANGIDVQIGNGTLQPIDFNAGTGNHSLTIAGNMVTGNAQDGISIFKDHTSSGNNLINRMINDPSVPARNGTTLDVDIANNVVNANAGRGLDIETMYGRQFRVDQDGDGVTEYYNDVVFDIVGNSFNNNGEQGMVLFTNAPVEDALRVLFDPAGENFPPEGIYRDAQSRDNVAATFALIGNTVQGNGTADPGNPQTGDGVVLSVGSNTRMNADVQGNTFGGNAGADLRMFPVVSDYTIARLVPSIDDRPDTAELQYDPTAHLDLRLGTNLVNGLGNRGDHVSVETLGVPETDGITNTGLFVNPDPLKINDDPLGRGRRVRGVFQVQAESLLNDRAFNDFERLGVQQDLVDTFLSEGVIVNPILPFPDRQFNPNP